MGIFDVVKALGDITNKIIQMPQQQRKEYRKALSETCILLQQAIGIPRNKLYTILRSNNKLQEPDRPEDLRRELQDLQYFDWAAAERLIYLCEPLRDVADEMGSRKNQIKGKIAVPELDELANLIQGLLGGGEQSVGNEIKQILNDLSELGHNSDLSIPANFEKARKAVGDKIVDLDETRRELNATEFQIRQAIKP